MIYRNWALLQVLVTQRIAEYHMEAQNERLRQKRQWFPVRLAAGRIADWLSGSTPKPELTRVGGDIHPESAESPCSAELPGK